MEPPFPNPPFREQELIGRNGGRVLISTVLGLQGVYLACSIIPNPFFGVNQFSFLGWPICLTLLLLSWCIPSYLGTFRGGMRLGQNARREWFPWRLRWVVAGLGVALFLLLPSRKLNPDGEALLEKIPQDVALKGAHVTHDEMLELYLHSVLYRQMNKRAGWSVVDCYRVTSALAGGVYLLLLFSVIERIVAPGSRTLFLALVLGGGYIQLFFGDVENYALVTVAILAFLLAAYDFLSGRLPLWVPSLILAAAIGLHLVAGWMIPSLALLFSMAIVQQRHREWLLGVATFVLPLLGLLVFFHYNGLPIQRLFDSSHVFGMGGEYQRYFAPMTLTMKYIGGMANVLLLILPSVVLLPVLVASGRLGNDPAHRLTQVAALGMLVFLISWRAQLGPRQDWNLYAPVAVPVGLMVAGAAANAFGGASVRHRGVLGALAISGAAHTAAWVIRNHLGL